MITRSAAGVALFVVVADLFLGAAALILVLIVISSKEEPRVPRRPDLVVSCRPTDDSGSWLITEESGPARSIDEWIKAASAQGLLVRAGLLVERNEMACFRAVEEAVRAHNRALSARGMIAASLTLVFLPDRSEAEP